VDAPYHVDQVVGSDADDEIRSALEQLAREGARQMLEWALEEEVKEFLGRERYARSTEFRGYRNGFQRPREVAVGTWSVPVRAPRVSDVPRRMPGLRVGDPAPEAAAHSRYPAAVRPALPGGSLER